ncbi:TlpA disulfide reductase family protein [Halobacillus sp. Marseille-Q1614]|uniref:TlpA family protein disulfide reductase n=1 Tax=Halobacillus sp. Marseille-Q1614 TaxID=2709134 RepID=UPI00156F2250|nr:TlpA disulfide reductase family protein [Halobacillus sp. Marseille-Q1614]
MKLAPDFTLPYIDSENNFTLSQQQGKVVILTFWASWCTDCGIDMPKKEQLFQTMDHSKVSMLTINVTGRERSIHDAEDYYDKFLTQPTLTDRGTKIYKLYKAKGVPTTVIINQEGELAFQFNDKADFLDIVKAIGTLI